MWTWLPQYEAKVRKLTYARVTPLTSSMPVAIHKNRHNIHAAMAIKIAQSFTEKVHEGSELP